MLRLRSRYAPGLVGLSALLAGIVGCNSSNFAPVFDPAARPAMEKLDGGEQLSAEEYNRIVENPFLSAAAHPRSTFSTSVDTASYSNVRRFLTDRQMPPIDAVRVADMLNYFSYTYPEPRGDHAVAAGLEMGPCPWQPKHHLLRIAVKAKTISPGQMPPRNLVFLIDTSGSMNHLAKLPLVQQSMELLVKQLGEQDRVSIVTYAGTAGVALSPTPGNQTRRIVDVIHGLGAGGSTNGSGGIVAAYDLAQRAFIHGGVNRVILATDGDFNVGVSDEGSLVRLIEQKRDTGVFLTVLGFGMGNLKDNKLEQLSHHGNGHYAYVDTIDEARKVFVDQGGALAVVAKDVKLQVEFNHRQVNAYRLIGYENRLLRVEDFRDDAKDAGDMGSGHTCTALYEIVPAGVEIPLPSAGDLKYQKPAADTKAAESGEWLTLRMRYKDVDTDKATELAVEMPANGLSIEVSDDFRFAASVAAFGMLLRDSPYKGDATFDRVLGWASAALDADRNGERSEFVGLVGKARRLKK